MPCARLSVGNSNGSCTPSCTCIPSPACDPLPVFDLYFECHCALCITALEVSEALYTTPLDTFPKRSGGCKLEPARLPLQKVRHSLYNKGRTAVDGTVLLQKRSRRRRQFCKTSASWGWLPCLLGNALFTRSFNKKQRIIDESGIHLPPCLAGALQILLNIDCN